MVTRALRQLLILVDYSSRMMSLLLDVIFFGLVVIGIPFLLDLHKFMVAISRIEVNHDGSGGTALDAMVWDRGGLVKTRASSLRIIVDYASLPGPLGFWACSCCNIPSTPVTQEDVAAWPYSVNILLEFTSILASLHWPQGGGDLGKFGISYFELLLLIELFLGHRLNCEKVIRPHLRAKRPLVGSRILPSDPREIRQGCQFVCSLFRSLNRLPGGFAGFIPCQPIAHYARLVHVGWTQCGHGLSSRPRESCDILLVHPLLSFLGIRTGLHRSFIIAASLLPSPRGLLPGP